MLRHVASIVHLTDLHLDPTRKVGAERRDDRRGIARVSNLLRTIPGAAWMAEGIEGHDEHAWLALNEVLPGVLRDERASVVPDGVVVVAQTGDVEARGGRPFGDPQVAYSGWTALRELREAPEVVRHLNGWSDVYGNHDTWLRPSFLPDLRSPTRLHHLQELARDPAGNPHFPDASLVTTIPSCDLSFEIFRLNTVDTSLLFGSIASGRIDSSPPYFGPENAVWQLTKEIERCGAPRGSRVVRAVLMHHPPSYFAPDASPRYRWTEHVQDVVHEHTVGRLVGVDHLRASLESHGIWLTLAGHRHQEDPDDVAPNPSGVVTRAVQDLPAGSGQLVASSPTKQGPAHAFPVYRIYLNDEDELELRRFSFELNSPAPAEAGAGLPRFKLRPTSRAVMSRPETVPSLLAPRPAVWT